MRNWLRCFLGSGSNSKSLWSHWLIKINNLPVQITLFIQIIKHSSIYIPALLLQYVHPTLTLVNLLIIYVNNLPYSYQFFSVPHSNLGPYCAPVPSSRTRLSSYHNSMQILKYNCLNIRFFRSQFDTSNLFVFVRKSLFLKTYS